MEIEQQRFLQQQILKAVLLERVRQDEKFEPMPRNLTPSAWLTVLVEEVGEVARAALEGDSSNYVQELIQVAAVAVAALEDFHLGQPDREIKDVCIGIEYLNQQEQATPAGHGKDPDKIQLPLRLES